MPFDPDAYLSGGQSAAVAPPPFDPDAYLSQQQAQPAFDPDQYLGIKPPSSTPASDVAAATAYGQRMGGPTTAEEAGMEKAFAAAHPSLYGVARGVAGMIPTPEQVIQAGEEVNKASEHPIASLATLPGQIIKNATEMGKAARGDYGPEAQAQTITGAVLTAAPLLHLPFAKGVDLAREAPPVQTRGVEPAEAMRPPPETAEPYVYRSPIGKLTAEAMDRLEAQRGVEAPAAAEQPPTIVAEPAPGVSRVYRGSETPELHPELKDFGAVFTATDKATAEQYGKHVAEYSMENPKLLDAEGDAAQRLAEEYSGQKYSTTADWEDAFTGYYAFPTKEFAQFVKEKGYDGYTVGKDVAVFDPKILEPAPPEPAPPEAKGLSSAMFSAKGSTDVFYEKAFDALQQGKSTVSGVKDPILARHKAAFDRGEITSPEELKAAEEGTAPPAAAEAPKANLSNLPDWMQEDIQRRSAPLEKSGVADQIEELAAQRLTAKQIATQLGLDITDVNAVRASRGIPSMNMGGGGAQISPEFAAWEASRKAPPRAAEPPQVGETTTEGPIAKLPPPETPGTQPPPVSGINNERLAQIYGPDAITAGKGRSASAWKQVGQADKRDPYTVLDNARRQGIATPADVANLRTEHQRLLNDARNAYGTPQYGELAKRAVDMANAIKGVAHGPASDVFRALQEQDIPRYESPADFDNIIRERMNRESTPTEKATFQKATGEVQSANGEAVKAASDAQTKLRQSRPRAAKEPMKFEDAADYIRKQIEELTKECAT